MKNMEHLEDFKGKAKSNLVREILDRENVSVQEYANALNCQIPSLRNKFSRDSFSLYDYLVLCQLCGLEIAIIENEKKIDMRELLTDEERKL